MPPATQTGNRGATRVTEAFEELNWGVADNSRDDLGTDLLVMPRDERGVSLSLLMGVQVKTGDATAGGKYFSEPVHDPDSGKLAGWWFRDPDRRHIDAWLRYDVPHLLVLHDIDARVSYWVHITADAVVSTGKGAKVFVSADHRIDLAHRDELFTVATSQRPRVEWEGSAWRGPESLSPDQVLRHAVLVPRLVAPHPNLTLTEALTAEQALALLVRVQTSALEGHLDLDPLDEDREALEKALERPGWRWRLARALLHRLTTGDATEVLAAMETAEGSADRTVSTIAAAATLIEDGDVEGADRLLVSALERDDADHIDHAWLCLQRARCLGEIGRLDEARELAVVAQRARKAYPDDLTASAIGGIGAMTLYRLTRNGAGNFAEGVSGLDTMAVWWRNLTTYNGLTVSAATAFGAWARHTAVTWGARDSANDDVLAASLMAGYLGDQSAWRFLSALLAKERLMRLDRHSDPQEAHEALTALCRSGDHQATKLAVRRFTDDGPATAVTAAAREIDLALATRTTARPALALLRTAGDLLDEDTADRTCTWLLATLDDLAGFLARTQPTYSVRPELINTLSRAVVAAATTVQQRVAEYLANLPPQHDSRVAKCWARVARALHRSSWTAHTAARLGANAAAHAADLRAAAHEVAAHYDPGEREKLIPLIDQGSASALVAFGDVGDLPADTARAKIDQLVAACGQIRERAKTMSHAGGDDVARRLTLLNTWHPEHAQWRPLIELLADPRVWPDDKNGALLLLAQVRPNMDDSDATRLRDIADQLATATPMPGFGFFGGDTDSRAPALGLAYSLADPDEPTPVARHHGLVALLGGNHTDRRWAAYIARHAHTPSGAGLLTSLIHDSHPEVRAEAAASLVHRIDHETQPDGLAQAAATLALDDPGALVGKFVVARLEEWMNPTNRPHRDDLLQRLANHPSATVRAQAAAALEGDGSSG